MLLLQYDEAELTVPEGVRMIRDRGGKWLLARRHLVPELLEAYDYLFFWDDDIAAGAFDPVAFVEIMQANRLEMAQPALRSPHGLSHQITRWRPCPPLQGGSQEGAEDAITGRLTNFMEIMVPVFTRAARREFYSYLDSRNRSGWGYDYIPNLMTPEAARDAAIEVLSKVISDTVLLVEDDVVPPAGSAAILRETLAGQGPETAAVMGAYRSRQRPDCVCAHDLQGRYIPWADLPATGAPDGNQTAAPLPAAWIGGGLTLRRTAWLKPCLPLEIGLHSGWVEGWDMKLASRLRAGGGRLLVLPQIQAEHSCPEVLHRHQSWKAKSSFEVLG